MSSYKIPKYSTYKSVYEASKVKESTMLNKVITAPSFTTPPDPKDQQHENMSTDNDKRGK